MESHDPATGQHALHDFLQHIGPAAVAFGYEVWADGVFQRKESVTDLSSVASPLRFCPPAAQTERKRIALRPVWISGLGYTIDTDEPLVQLSYGTTDRRIATIWLGRGEITEHHLLQKLGARGIPVDSLNTKDILLFLRETESVNARVLPNLLVGHRSGPYSLPGGARGWLLGRHWIGPEGSHLAPDPRENTRYMAAFQQKGDRKYWMDWWHHLYRHRWVTRWVIAASFATPLLRLLGIRTFFVHHWGNSSSGKTAILYFAQSVWGDPLELYSSMNSTEIALTEIFKHVTDFPVAYDEKQVSTIEIPQLIYTVCLATGRERGAKDGGVRTDRQSWLTIARTTGEVPLIGRDDVGGQSNRVMQVHTHAFDTEAEGARLYPLTRDHFGFAGPEFLHYLSKLVETPEGQSQLTANYLAIREEIKRRAGRDGNHTTYAAVIALGSYLSAMWLLGISPEQALDDAYNDAMHALKETSPETRLPYAERALNLLRDHWMANPMLYADASTDEAKHRLLQDDLRMPKLVGVTSDYGIAYVPTEADRILRDARFSTERVWRDFADLGWLRTTQGSNTLTVPIPLRGERSPQHPCYFIEAAAFLPGRGVSTPPGGTQAQPQGNVVSIAGGLRLVKEG